MSNRIDEFVNAFDSWMAEWYANRNLGEQVSGLSANFTQHSILDDSCGQGQATADASLESVQTGRTTAGIQPQGHVGEDGGWIPDWRDEEGSDVRPEIEVHRGR